MSLAVALLVSAFALLATMLLVLAVLLARTRSALKRALAAAAAARDQIRAAEAMAHLPPPESAAPADPRGSGRPSMEPHIDADQRAEFLMVLGQDQAAIDMLLEHLRGSGGSSPLAYLRLMQIYRGRSDREAYERTRERFNQRFNACAPKWQADGLHQRALDSYPSVLAEVQSAWPAPDRAMAVVEALLFRRGMDDADRFDLPAYEELLLLYWLTRELQREPADPAWPQTSPPGPGSLAEVDIPLPLDEGLPGASVIQRAGSYDSTAVFTQVELARHPASVALDLELDIDLATTTSSAPAKFMPLASSEPAQADSAF